MTLEQLRETYISTFAQVKELQRVAIANGLHLTGKVVLVDFPQDQVENILHGTSLEAHFRDLKEHFEYLLMVMPSDVKTQVNQNTGGTFKPQRNQKNRYRDLASEILDLEHMFNNHNVSYRPRQFEDLGNLDNVSEDVMSRESDKFDDYMSYLKSLVSSKELQQMYDYNSKIYQEENMSQEYKDLIEVRDWIFLILDNLKYYDYEGKEKLKIARVETIKPNSSSKRIKKSMKSLTKYANYLQKNIPTDIIQTIEEKGYRFDNENPTDFGVSTDYQTALNNLNKESTMEDDLARHTKTKVGTKEHRHWQGLHKEVQEINSVGKLSTSAYWLRKVGNIAVFPVAIIHLMGLIYDVDYHVPSLKEDFGIVPVGIFSAFIVAVILLFTHKLSDNLINNSLKPKVKRTFTILFIFGISLSFYFSWRAIDNYTKGVVEQKQAISIATGNSAGSMMASTYAKQIQAGVARVNSINTQLLQNNTRLGAIPTTKSELSARKLKALDKLGKIKNYVTKKKQREIIKGIEKEIGRLDTETQNLRADNISLQNQLDSLQTKALTLAGQQKGALSAMQTGMDAEQLQREIFLFLLVLFIEIASLGSVIAMFVQDKNLEDDHHDKLQSINTLHDRESLLNKVYDDLETDKLRHMGQFAERRRVTNEVVNQFGAMTSESHIGTLNMITKTTGQTIEATKQVAELAVAGMGKAIIADTQTALSQSLQTKVNEQNAQIQALLSQVQKGL